MQFNEMFSYDPIAGSLTWKFRPREHFKTHKGWRVFCSRFQGNLAGRLSKTGRRQGGMVVCVDYVLHKVHRIIWEMHNGPIPSGMVIDHINGNVEDNRLENLRVATNAENMRNRGCTYANQYGLKGVSWMKAAGKYQAGIKVDGKRIALGLFPTKGLAAVSYAKASLRYHGAFSPFAR